MKSVQFFYGDIPNSYPIIDLGTGQSVSLHFDELVNNPKDYQFTIIHCDANWRPSQLIKSEFIEGMFTDYLSGYQVSTGTYKGYVHYRLAFPSQNMKPKISGNYLLKIFLDNEKNVVITRRFYVVQKDMNVSGEMLRPSSPRYNDTKQQISFTINTNEMNVGDPFNDIKVVIRQNWRPDNELANLKPKYVEGKKLIYNYDDEALFDGGNEFRFFDIRDVKYRSNGVRYFMFDSATKLYSATLFEDEDHSGNAYTKYIDQDGGYINLSNSNDLAFINADYIWVDFRLRIPYADESKDVFVYGGLSNWQLDKNFKLTYSPRDKEYQGRILLKQGFYDYQYVTLDKSGNANFTAMEGSHWETENNYSVFVYFRPMGANYDLLVGKASLNSAK
ncbi:MAG: DUF5103 domain-containing protein [Bacteroidetes bacterium]|nr:DUF5103 domain-containing protein [Bacteroidota bacterium]